MSETLTEQKIIELKTKLISNYTYLISAILLVFALLCRFLFADSFMFYYILAGIAVIQWNWFIARRGFGIENLVRAYIIIAPFWMIFPIIRFWDYSVANFFWLSPIPFAAYIFFKKREVLFYSLYALAVIATSIVLANIYNIEDTEFNPLEFQKIRYTDTLVFASNLFVIGLLSYYGDKIRTLKLGSIKNEQNVDLSTIASEKQDIEYFENLFEKIENEIAGNMLFRDSDLNISMLNPLVKVNNNYISKAIRHKNFPNFNTYINSHRIEYVKQLMKESDLEKVTLMYIYTEAGFTNQATFNRVFKQFEKITPSEYLQKMERAG
jgi:AraC-like DNA-binding protein